MALARGSSCGRQPWARLTLRERAPSAAAPRALRLRAVDCCVLHARRAARVAPSYAMNIANSGMLSSENTVEMNVVWVMASRSPP